MSSHGQAVLPRSRAGSALNGYYFAKGVSPVVAEHDTSDDAMESAAKKQTTAPAPQAGVNARTLPPQETWGNGMY